MTCKRILIPLKVLVHLFRREEASLCWLLVECKCALPPHSWFSLEKGFFLLSVIIPVLSSSFSHLFAKGLIYLSGQQVKMVATELSQVCSAAGTGKDERELHARCRESSSWGWLWPEPCRDHQILCWTFSFVFLWGQAASWWHSNSQLAWEHTAK